MVVLGWRNVEARVLIGILCLYPLCSYGIVFVEALLKEVGLFHYDAVRRMRTC